jgi:hypothetical protein
MAQELQRSPLGEVYTLSNDLLRADQIDDVARSVGAGG